MSADEIRRAAELLDDGASYCEVARTVGRCPDIIRKHLPGRSTWTPADGGKFHHYMTALDAIRVAS